MKKGLPSEKKKKVRRKFVSSCFLRIKKKGKTNKKGTFKQMGRLCQNQNRCGGNLLV